MHGDDSCEMSLMLKIFRRKYGMRSLSSKVRWICSRSNLNLADTLDKIEAALIRRALVRADFVQAHAADLLGISRSLMQYKLKKYNISGH